jgi:hypothetical protein
MKTNSILSKVILFAGLILFCNQGFSQSKFEISGGLSVPEILNIKLKYGHNFKVGASVHYWYYSAGGIFSEYNDWSCALEASYYFSMKSEDSEQPAWYLLGGLGYYHIDYLIDWPYDNYGLCFYPRIGKVINFSGRTGINMDIGMFLPFTASSGNPYKFKVLPSGSIGFFIRM